MNEGHWYKDAIFYEVNVRGFFDANGDGRGDLEGLISKLDYLQGLGVDCLWLLPTYPSPLKDDGYDVTDFCGVHPEYGTLADFDRLIAEAHRRGLRIVGDLVLNHCSSEHPWFLAARSDRASPYRDYFVWRDDTHSFKDTRIIFSEVEKSNWSFDEVAGQYYWHRFYSHQPDLNYDNPKVQDEMLAVADFWLRRGIDGFRCDAVPYLYERDGTNCESLPETHAFVKRLRAHVDANFSGRVLIAEANQWPEDLVPYFDGEFQMAFHFPLMPRIFLALRRGSKTPIVEILERTPPIHEGCQWGLFLRNHDELTLEMVTDAERDYLYDEYAKEPEMRHNAGIRRRLAPLLGGSRPRIELLYALLFSLPGSPFLYYGDELGMGDNVRLGDRDGMRTPMQWSGDVNAGFSRAEPSRLYSPVSTDALYDHRAVNVDVEDRVDDSLLRWVRRMIRARKTTKAFGRGTFSFVDTENEAVLSFVRTFESEEILVVAK